MNWSMARPASVLVSVVVAVAVTINIVAIAAVAATNAVLLLPLPIMLDNLKAVSATNTPSSIVVNGDAVVSNDADTDNGNNRRSNGNSTYK